ncbi:MAG: hypothetical protein HDT28_03035 [Clostridiales bacterium]|nr:hypothetical protein [Clostridiales bacterium]
MINIAKKKLPFWAITIILYLSYCLMNWYVMRGSLAYYGQQYGLPSALCNDAVAFFLAGLVPFVLFELFATAFRSISLKTGGDVASLRYGLTLTLIATNVLLFLLKFIYIAVPLYASVINVILDPVITVGAVALYMWYAFYQEYIDKTRYRIALTQVMTLFCVVYGLLALLNIFLSVAG